MKKGGSVNIGETSKGRHENSIDLPELKDFRSSITLSYSMSFLLVIVTMYK